jgi:hypothetical protein
MIYICIYIIYIHTYIFKYCSECMPFFIYIIYIHTYLSTFQNICLSYGPRGHDPHSVVSPPRPPTPPDPHREATVRAYWQAPGEGGAEELRYAQVSNRDLMKMQKRPTKKQKRPTKEQRTPTLTLAYLSADSSRAPNVEAKETY